MSALYPLVRDLVPPGGVTGPTADTRRTRLSVRRGNPGAVTDEVPTDIHTETPGPLLDPQEGECVLCFTARAVDELGCDGTARWAERFVAVRVPPATGTVRRMTPTGECDCAIVGQRHALVRDQLVRDVHTDELVQPDRRPTCAGVRRTSARPCRHWERVPRRVTRVAR